MTNRTVFTIGHSTHPLERFISLLQRNGVTAVADVRSAPYSRVNPQFNRETFQAALNSKGIAYVFLGKELGARSNDPTCYINGKVRYERLAETDLFRSGIARLQQGIAAYQLALMCAEKDPLACHRTILVARYLHRLGIQVQHILEDGRLESHEEVTTRLTRQLRLPDSDMFRSHEDIINEAYKIQAEKIAYEERKHEDIKQVAEKV